MSTKDFGIFAIFLEILVPFPAASKMVFTFLTSFLNMKLIVHYLLLKDCLCALFLKVYLLIAHHLVT